MSIADVEEAIENLNLALARPGAEALHGQSARLVPRGLPLPETQVHQRYSAPMLT
jgi:hypothetical protein